LISTVNHDAFWGKQHGNYRIQQKNKGDEPATQFKARTLLDGPLLMADHSENASL
jgi:hypothetical protein